MPRNRGEDAVQRKFVDWVDWLTKDYVERYKGDTKAGWPDWFLFWRGGLIEFVELKAPGEKPNDLQLHRHECLRKLGFDVYVIDSVDGVNQFFEERRFKWNI